MQKHNKVVTIAGLALGAGLLATAATQTAFAHGKNTHAQNITVTVDDKGYHPAQVNVKAGQEVHMTFVSKGDSCSNGIRIPALHKSIDLKKGQKKEITFSAKKGQTIAFACPMKMFKGKIVAK